MLKDKVDLSDCWLCLECEESEFQKDLGDYDFNNYVGDVDDN